MEDIKFVLRTVNGVTIILILMAMLFLVLYVVNQHKKRKLTWWQDMTRPTPGVALAQPMLLIKAGWMVTRGPIWVWQTLDGSLVMPSSVYLTMITGTMITAVGFIWLIRVISYFRYGHWPWQLTSTLIVLYAICSALINYY